MRRKDLRTPLVVDNSEIAVISLSQIHHGSRPMEIQNEL